MKLIVIYRNSYKDCNDVYQELFKKINDRFYPKVITGYGNDKKIIVRDKVCIRFFSGDVGGRFVGLGPIYGYSVNSYLLGLSLSTRSDVDDDPIELSGVEDIYNEVVKLVVDKKEVNNKCPYEDIFAAAGFSDDQFELAKFCREFGFDPYAIIALLNNMKRRDEL